MSKRGTKAKLPKKTSSKKAKVQVEKPKQNSDEVTRFERKLGMGYKLKPEAVEFVRTNLKHLKKAWIAKALEMSGKKDISALNESDMNFAYQAITVLKDFAQVHMVGAALIPSSSSSSS